MSKYLLFLSALFLLTCESSERIWSNPNDPDIGIDPSAWAPSNLQAQVLNDSEIKLTWEQEEENIAGFRLERQVNSGSFTQIVEVGADVTEYTDTGLNYGTDYTYRYRVKAFTDENESGYCYFAVTDIDGNVYETVIIGEQEWTVTNLKVRHYRNGDPIPTGLSDSQWSSTTAGAYAVYDNNESNADTYGYLYNWYAVDDSRNIAPEGWHVPTDAEWTILTDYLGGSSVAGGKMKETGTEHWNSPNTGATNESGFTALPGGCRYYGGGYYDMGNFCYFWSSTDYNSGSAWSRYLYYNYSGVSRDGNDKQYGFSVRVVRD